jgi:hypothetical protein
MGRKNKGNMELAKQLDQADAQNWTELIENSEWEQCDEVVTALRQEGIAFALGGGFAFFEYSPRGRTTKDVDLFVKHEDMDRIRGILARHGFRDYHDEEAYDRSWIYRAERDGLIIDFIWAAPNHRMQVDDRWLTNGRSVTIAGCKIQLLPPEELIWSKIYVLQHDRCDWPDLLNVLYNEAETLDWEHLLNRMGDDAPILGALMSVFRWLSPDKAVGLPNWIWQRLGLSPLTITTSETERERAAILDTRNWYGPPPQEGGKKENGA